MKIVYQQPPLIHFLLIYLGMDNLEVGTWNAWYYFYTKKFKGRPLGLKSKHEACQHRASEYKTHTKGILQSWDFTLQELQTLLGCVLHTKIQK